MAWLGGVPAQPDLLDAEGRGLRLSLAPVRMSGRESLDETAVVDRKGGQTNPSSTLIDPFGNRTCTSERGGGCLGFCKTRNAGVVVDHRNHRANSSKAALIYAKSARVGSRNVIC